MKEKDFRTLIGKNLTVDYDFNGEIQQWSMLNFYIDDKDEIKHKNIKSLIIDVFIKGCSNPKIGKPTHG